MTTTESPVNPPEPGAAPSVSDAGVNADAAGADAVSESDPKEPLLADALTSTPKPETATLRAALADANAEIARQQDAVQRGRADLANARRRHDEERIGIRQQANSGLLVRLLPIVDELDLAVTHLETGGNGAGAGGVSVPGPGADPASAAASWIEGVRLIQRKLASFLEAEGVTRIAALGEIFNPERHEAVGMAQVDGAASGCIVEVVRQGYLLHDRVVQAAQVVVNR